MKNLMMILMIMIAGCSFLNPYESDYLCPDGDPGKCITVKQAHFESAGAGKNPLIIKDECKDCDKTDENLYDGRKERVLYEITKSLDDTEDMPAIINAKPMRILILQYKGKNNLYGSRYIYFFVNDPEFVLSTTQVE
ncbi:MAG: TraV family lipoprotein [bacterium]|nr:TraV family lipoprotein [bacterium]